MAVVGLPLWLIVIGVIAVVIALIIYFVQRSKASKTGTAITGMGWVWALSVIGIILVVVGIIWAAIQKKPVVVVEPTRLASPVLASRTTYTRPSGTKVV